MLVLLACTDPADTAPDKVVTTLDSGTTAVPTLLALPFITVGDPAPSASLDVTGAWSLDGPFSGAEAAGVLTVTLDADLDTPALHAGTLTMDGVELPVSAVVGAEDLPDITWDSDAWGAWTVAPFATAPYPYGSAPYDDPSVYIAVPRAFVATDPFGSVLHLHGHNAVIEDTVADQYLREQTSLSGRNAVLVAPQGPYNAADSDFGRLETPDGAQNLLRDVISVLYRDGWTQRASLDPVVLTSHSGGYQATASIVQQGGVDVDSVHLFDSLYAYESVFADYAATGRLLSVYTASGGTDDNNVALRDTLEADGISVARHFDDATLDSARVIIAASDASHAGCVSEDRNYARWLRASGLPASATAAPELRVVQAEGADMTVAWRDESGVVWTVETSPDGVDWTIATTTTWPSVSVPLAPWVRVHADGASSDTYGATGADWWIIDGFDRVLDGSWGHPTHDFVAQVLADAGVAASTASNEAVADGTVDLSGATGVIWLLGDEGTADHTFDADEMAAIDSFLATGGRLIVSGAEVGYATDGAWLAGTLDAAYLADDAGTDTVSDFEIGTAYPEDYPDVLAGEATIWSYATGGAAAVAGPGVVVVGFGVENIDPDARAAALTELIAASE